MFQSEHLSLLLGSGFTSAIAAQAGAPATGMGMVPFDTRWDELINEHATASAVAAGRGTPNLEDQFRSVLALIEGLSIQKDTRAGDLQGAMNAQLRSLLVSLLATEKGIADGKDAKARAGAATSLQSFLLTFASRAASRERVHIFTTNYDRLIEHGCDLAGLRVIDRFVGALNPLFRSSRVDVDVHYNPPGIRGEPRFLEGVVRLTKLHGSLDWRLDRERRQIRRIGLPMGAPSDHTEVPKDVVETVMIYPNPAKDVETTAYPYAELFRDFAAALCRPNSAIVAYGYGFGDDHVNRVLVDMLTIPSTHMVIVAYSVDDRLKAFYEKVGRSAQISLLIGTHFAAVENLVEHYLPKPALDYITARLTELLKNRPEDRQDPTLPPPAPGSIPVGP